MIKNRVKEKSVVSRNIFKNKHIKLYGREGKGNIML